MESPGFESVKLLLELEPRGRAFWSSFGAALRPVRAPHPAELGLLHDAFVRRPMPWSRFLQSAVLHGGGIALVWMLTIAWLQNQTVVRPAFDRSSVLTYSPAEYLPPLDTGQSGVTPQRKGEPEYAKQAIISVPREPDNRSQTIVAPPDVRLTHDVPMPNIVAMGTPIPSVPIDAARTNMARMVIPEAIVAPAPDVDNVNGRALRNALDPSVVAPAPNLAVTRTHAIAGPEAAVIEPPPDISKPDDRRIGTINIGTASVVAPAPQLPVAAQRALSARMKGGLPGSGGAVAPAPSISASMGTGRGTGRLIALGIHPVNPGGPIAPPGGNRRGTFAATPQGKPGAPGTPDQTGPASASKGTGHGGNGNGGGSSAGDSSLPAGLHVGASESGPTGAIAGTGGESARSAGQEPRVMAKVTAPRVTSSANAAKPVSEDKVTDLDRQVFGEKRFYSMTANMPNLNSATGSWIIRFAELKGGQKGGELLAPQARQQSDPGYPLELMRENVQGTVTLYAVIHSDGSVSDIRVLSSPDDRLDQYASKALARWKFDPAIKDGKPVAVEAVVVIPFRIRRQF